MVTAIIVAAGSSTRMGFDKIMAPLCGKPLFIHSVLAFASSNIERIVIVTSDDKIEAIKDEIIKYDIKKPCIVTKGGKTRQESVNCGAKMAENSEIFAIHDGARPLITPGEINAVLEEVKKFGAASAAVPVKDTIKIIDENGFIKETPNRDYLYSAQTPQCMKSELYFKGYNLAKTDYTDDNALLEAINIPVKLVKTSYKNIKVTTAEDLAVAKKLMEEI